MKMTLTLLAGYRAAALLSALLTLGAVPFAKADPLSRLKVSDNHRFLVTAEGKPFFWLGDTAWELFRRLKREEAIAFLDDRAGRPSLWAARRK